MPLAQRRSPRHTIRLLGFLAVLMILSGVTDLVLLAALWGAALVMAFREAGALLKKTAVLVGPFVATLAGAMVVYDWWTTGHFEHWDVLGSIFLRGTLSTFFVLWVVRRINLFEAVKGSKELTLLLSLAVAQIYTYRRILSDFYLALKSRGVGKPSLAQSLKWTSAISSLFMVLSVNVGKETSLALRSRGM